MSGSGPRVWFWRSRGDRGGGQRVHVKKTKNNDVADKPSPRRSFLNKLWLGLSGIAFFELSWMAISFLKPRQERRQGEFGTIMEAGPVSGFAHGSVTAYPRGHFYLARLEDGGFLAIHRRCTHLGCTVPWVGEEKQFLCPCHSSAFDIRGDVINSPAPRALDIFQIAIENDKVFVDTGRIVRRSGFSRDQVTYPGKL